MRAMCCCCCCAQETFDEVSEELVIPRWDYDLKKLVQSLDQLIPIVHHVDELEKAIEQMKKVADRLQLKAARRTARLAAGDSDEDDDDDEEEEEEEDDFDRPPPPPHTMIVALQHLKARVVGGSLELLTYPQPLQSFQASVSTILADQVLDKMDDYRQQAIAATGLQDFITRGIPIPTLPSPFTSPEGAAIWANALQLTSPVAEPANAKGAKKPPKNAPPPTAPTPQQVEYYYKELYSIVRDSLLSACNDMFCISSHMITSNIEELHSSHPLHSQHDISHIAMPRGDDIHRKVVFMTLDGDTILFNDSSTEDSAFPIRTQAVDQLASQLVQLLAHEPKLVVLLNESAASHIASSLSSQLPTIQAALQKQWGAYEATDKKIQKKLKIPLKHYKQPELKACANFAEIYHQLDSWLRSDASSHLPIFILENLRSPGVVPDEPEYVMEDSDDDEAPVFIGKEAAAVYHRNKWEQRRPFRVPITINTSHGKSMVQHCYADSVAAIRELILTASSQNDEIVWLDGQSRVLFDPLSSFNHESYPELTQKRFVTAPVRESFGWCAVLASLSSFPATFTSNEEGADRVSAVQAHMQRLFPQCTLSNKKPNVVIVLGGELRPDKLRVLDELITMVP
jgi:hypothetical protein